MCVDGSGDIGQLFDAFLGAKDHIKAIALDMFTPPANLEWMLQAAEQVRYLALLQHPRGSLQTRSRNEHQVSGSCHYKGLSVSWNAFLGLC